MDPIPERVDEDPRRPRDDFAKYLELVNNCDENEPLLSESPLGQCLAQIQLACVAPGLLIQLNQALNVEQLIPTRSGLARDYRGLAELMGFSLVELEARFKRSHNPAKCLIEAFANRHHRQGTNNEVTLNDLLKLLESLERFDIVDDLLPTLIDLVQREQQATHQRQLVARLEASHDNGSRTIAQSSAQQNTHQYSPDSQQARYDAFVCFASDDEDHARELILLLERHDKRVVTMEHLLPGQFEYDTLVQMIATECRKVIIVLTPNFLLSRECEFQTKFANEIAIKSGWFPKIIPVLCEPLDDSRLPPLIRVISKIDMTNRRANNHEWQLKKLLGSLEYDSNSQNSPGLIYEPRERYNQFASRSRADSASRVAANQSATRLAGGLDSGNHVDRNEPIVDLAYSQSSDSAMNLSCQLSIMTSSNDDHQLDGQQISSNSHLSTPSPNSNQNQQHQSHSPSGSTRQLNPLNWYKSFKRKVLPKSPCESMAPSTSSRTKLLQEPADDKN